MPCRLLIFLCQHSPVACIVQCRADVIAHASVYEQVVLGAAPFSVSDGVKCIACLTYHRTSRLRNELRNGDVLFLDTPLRIFYHSFAHLSQRNRLIFLQIFDAESAADG